MAQGGRETEIRTSRHPTKLRHGPPINVHLLISPGIGHRSMPIGIPILDPVEPRTQPAINESMTWPHASQTLNNRAINKIRIVVSRSPFEFFLIFFFFLFFFLFFFFFQGINRVGKYLIHDQATVYYQIAIRIPIELFRVVRSTKRRCRKIFHRVIGIEPATNISAGSM